MRTTAPARPATRSSIRWTARLVGVFGIALGLTLFTRNLGAQTDGSPQVTITVSPGPTPNPVGMVNGESKQVHTQLWANSMFDPNSVPYSGTLTGPTWQWRVAGVQWAAKPDDPPAEADPTTYTNTFGTPTAANTLLTSTFKAAGTWRVTVAAAATFSDSEGSTWTGEAFHELTITVVAGNGLTVMPQKQAVCAGGVTDPVHQTELVITLMDVNGNPAGGQMVNVSTTAGSVMPADGMTDSSGVLRAMLTSGSLAQTPGGNVVTATITATALPADVTGTATVAFEPTTCVFSAHPRQLTTDAASECVGIFSFGDNGVAGHEVEWKVTGLWDINRNPLDPALASIAGSFQPGASTMTDSQGQCLAFFKAAASPAVVQLAVFDKSVLRPNGQPATPDDERRPNGKEIVFVNWQAAVPSIHLREPRFSIKGVMGDMVPGQAGGRATPTKHFVTPKYSADIDGAAEVPDGMGGMVENYKRWVWIIGGAGGMADGTDFDSTKYEWKLTDETNQGRVPGYVTQANAGACYLFRSTPAKIKVEIIDKQMNVAVDTLYVWIVWATIGECHEKAPGGKQWVFQDGVLLGLDHSDIDRNKKLTNGGQLANLYFVRSRGWLFVAKISPAELFATRSDIPDLTGPYDKAVSRCRCHPRIGRDRLPPKPNTATSSITSWPSTAHRCVGTCPGKCASRSFPRRFQRLCGGSWMVRC